MEGEKCKINEIEDREEHAVSENRENVSDRPKKQVQRAELID